MKRKVLFLRRILARMTTSISSEAKTLQMDIRKKITIKNYSALYLEKKLRKSRKHENLGIDLATPNIIQMAKTKYRLDRNLH